LDFNRCLLLIFSILSIDVLGSKNIDMRYITVLDRLDLIKVDLPPIDKELPCQISNFLFNFSSNLSLQCGWFSASGNAEPAQPVASEDIVSQLASMGFNYLHCQKAAINTSNTGVEEAMNWLLSHMDDPG
jgi:hypothetical protein